LASVAEGTAARCHLKGHRDAARGIPAAIRDANDEWLAEFLAYLAKLMVSGDERDRRRQGVGASGAWSRSRRWCHTAVARGCGTQKDCG
jgi:hypothetical protein